jgi:hypothetical protein
VITVTPGVFEASPKPGAARWDLRRAPRVGSPQPEPSGCSPGGLARRCPGGSELADVRRTEKPIPRSGPIWRWRSTLALPRSSRRLRPPPQTTGPAGIPARSPDGHPCASTRGRAPSTRPCPRCVPRPPRAPRHRGAHPLLGGRPRRRPVARPGHRRNEPACGPDHIRGGPPRR